MHVTDEQALNVINRADQTPRPRRKLGTPLLLALSGVVTLAWTGFLGWGALRLIIYVFN